MFPPTTPMMERDDDFSSVEESKVPDPEFDDGGGDPTQQGDRHGDADETHGAPAAPVTRRLNYDLLNHVLTAVLNREPVSDSATDPLTCFVRDQGLNDIRMVISMDQEDFKAMGFDIDFATYRSLQTMNRWYNEAISNETEIDEEYDWFMSLTDAKLMRYLMASRRVTRIIGEPDTDAPGLMATTNVPSTVTTRTDSAKAKLESLRRSSLATFQSGKPPLPPSTTKPPAKGRISFAPGVVTTPSVPSTPAPTTTTTTTKPAPTPIMTNVTTIAPTTSVVQAPTTFPSTTTYVYSRAQEFDKGGRRSSSDYSKFQNREQWSKWHRALMGSAYEHKCENVLDPTYVPDPNDPDECELFSSQQRFMYSVFSKTLVEGKAADILREYSDPRDKSKFGDAQKIYVDLCDFFEGGAMTRVSAATLESRLTNIRLNKTWTKTVTTFVTTVSHLIRDHKEATKGIHTDGYYIEKLNATFLEHKDMSSHIQSMETQDAMLSRRLGSKIAPRTYEDHLHELSDYATILDN